MAQQMSDAKRSKPLYSKRMTNWLFFKHHYFDQNDGNLSLSGSAWLSLDKKRPKLKLFFLIVKKNQDKYIQ
jgi:hypothetical protein